MQCWKSEFWKAVPTHVAQAFSPDGEWLAFWSAGELKKVSVTEGAPVTLGSSESSFGMSWDEDDIIRVSRFFEGIEQLPANGGTLEVIQPLEGEQRVVGVPQLLPDGERLLFAHARQRQVVRRDRRKTVSATLSSPKRCRRFTLSPDISFFGWNLAICSRPRSTPSAAS